MTLLSSARMSAAILALGALTAVPAHAAGIDGSSLGLTWAVPFAGILLSIALCPLFLPHFWHKNFGKVAVFWALCCAVPLCAVLGFSVGTDAIVHVLLADYVPFIIFVGSLFVVAGGIHVRGSLWAVRSSMWRFWGSVQCSLTSWARRGLQCSSFAR